MAKSTYEEELNDLREYIKSNTNEDAKRPLLYPLFKQLFKDQFKIESDARGADVYIAGQLIVESKTNATQWCEGFYQALHYQKKFGLAYTTILVIAHEFVGIWKVDKLPEFAVILANTADANDAPSKVGKQHFRKTQNLHRQEILQAALYKLLPGDLQGIMFAGRKSLIAESYEILKILKNLDSNRILIGQHNFIHTIRLMEKYFDTPIDAIHGFYTIVAYWDITATVADNEYEEGIRVVGFKANKTSEPVYVKPQHKQDFKSFVENHYVFTNEGSGLTADYYFSRFDEVIAELNPEYAKQHGIFFTDSNLSKFALWFVGEKFHPDLSERYIVFDPAGGSGNLVSSWRGNLKHKVVSELQPDLLRTIERRMRIDPYHTATGFTIIPKTSENRGLNFLDVAAEDYLVQVKQALQHNNLQMDKPLAFLMNPPYKNTDENQKVRDATDAHYDIHPSILALTGNDAGNERYLAFLGQIIRMANAQVQEQAGLQPIVMIFTPTSWLIPRPTYVAFRKQWDQHFAYVDGFITTSNAFFELNGKWPLAFTIWQFQTKEAGNDNYVHVYDLTHLKREDLAYNWNSEDKQIDKDLKKVIKETKQVNFSAKRQNIKDWVGQKMYDFKRSPTKTELESGEIYGGLPLLDERRENKKTYGVTDSVHIGFMDNVTPVRIKAKQDIRFAEDSVKRIWFYLDNRIIGLNLSKIFNGPSDKYGVCAYDINTAKRLSVWFSITKAINAQYPTWVNQFSLWVPLIKSEQEAYFYALCFAFVLAENRCVVTKFEADNPVAGAPEVFVDNPLCPTNPESFWSTTLDQEIVNDPALAFALVEQIKAFYKLWGMAYCKGQTLEHVGLQDEPYFKYFSYPDFLTPRSGLIQIRKYAEKHVATDLLEAFQRISALSKQVREEIYRLLVEEFGYFD